ncbi:MAG: T9SS type A sorting domain-containing protein, partial [Saprospiraceae bacterium]|nr:T9SS type A sorting domain-containing protein [Saprospiraceae bacterium]
TLFTIELIARTAGSVRELLTLDAGTLTPEGYTDLDELRPVGLDLYISDRHAGGLELGQNQPNPFAGSTDIPFYLTTDEQVELSIHDVQGRLVHHTSDAFSRGHHVITIMNDHFETSGMYYYTVSTSAHRATRRMTVLK